MGYPRIVFHETVFDKKTDRHFFENFVGSPELLITHVRKGCWSPSTLLPLLTIEARGEYGRNYERLYREYCRDAAPACAAQANYDSDRIKRCLGVQDPNAERVERPNQGACDRMMDFAGEKFKKAQIDVWITLFKERENRIPGWK